MRHSPARVRHRAGRARPSGPTTGDGLSQRKGWPVACLPARWRGRWHPLESSRSEWSTRSWAGPLPQNSNKQGCTRDRWHCASRSSAKKKSSPANSRARLRDRTRLECAARWAANFPMWLACGPEATPAEGRPRGLPATSTAHSSTREEFHRVAVRRAVWESVHGRGRVD